jgi:hypothetical protein
MLRDLKLTAAERRISSTLLLFSIFARCTERQ